MNNNVVLLDADFCNIILQNDKNISFFKSIFEILNINPAIHIYVFDNELFHNNSIKTLVSENYIKILNYSDFLIDDVDTVSYQQYFHDYYFFMNSEKLGNLDIFTYRKSGYNLGEIHSLITAQICKIPVFMSNDKGAKELAYNRINSTAFQIIVKNIEEVFNECEKISKLNSTIKRSIIKDITKKY